METKMHRGHQHTQFMQKKDLMKLKKIFHKLGMIPIKIDYICWLKIVNFLLGHTKSFLD